MKYYKIRDKETGLFKNANYGWSKYGRIWRMKKHAENSMRSYRNCEIVTFLLLEFKEEVPGVDLLD